MAEDSSKISELPDYPGGFQQAVKDQALVPLAMGNVSNAKIRVTDFTAYANQLIRTHRLIPGDNIQIDDNNVISATDTVYDDTALRERVEEIYTELEAEIAGINVGGGGGGITDAPSNNQAYVRFPGYWQTLGSQAVLLNPRMGTTSIITGNPGQAVNIPDDPSYAQGGWIVDPNGTLGILFGTNQGGRQVFIVSKSAESGGGGGGGSGTIPVGFSSTSASTAAKAVTLSNVTVTEGTLIAVSFSAANTATGAMTLNVTDSTGSVVTSAGVSAGLSGNASITVNNAMVGTAAKLYYFQYNRRTSSSSNFYWNLINPDAAAGGGSAGGGSGWEPSGIAKELLRGNGESWSPGASKLLATDSNQNLIALAWSL